MSVQVTPEALSFRAGESWWLLGLHTRHACVWLEGHEAGVGGESWVTRMLLWVGASHHAASALWVCEPHAATPSVFFFGGKP